MHNSLVSVIIPSYNHAKYIETCIKSVINQDYKSIELIIIDDGSTDESVDKINLLKEACKSRFLRFEFVPRGNKGLAQTLNEGLEWCKGEYIQCLASDDVILPHKTSCLVDYLEKNMGCAGVYGDVNHILANDLVIPRKTKNNNKYNFKDIALHKHYLPAPAQLLRANKLKNINGFNPKFIIEDWSIFLDLTKTGETIDYIGNVVSLYRQHDSNMSKNHTKMHDGRLSVAKHYADLLDYRKTLSTIFIIHSIEISRSSFIEALSFYLKALIMAPEMFFSRLSLRFLSGLVLPYFRKFS